MKNFTLISYQEGRCGFKEDDWQIIRSITNQDELYEALKEGYLEDASHRNNYPICSFPIGRIYIERELETEGLDNLGYLDDEDDIYDYRWEDNEDLDLSEYEKTFEKFEKWKNKINSLVPILKNNKRRIDKEISDIIKLNKLADKYGYELTKLKGIK